MSELEQKGVCEIRILRNGKKEKYFFKIPLNIARDLSIIFSFHSKKKKIITRAASIEFTDLDFEDRQKIAVKLTLTRYWRLGARSSSARAAE